MTNKTKAVTQGRGAVFLSSTSWPFLPPLTPYSSHSPTLNNGPTAYGESPSCLAGAPETPGCHKRPERKNQIRDLFRVLRMFVRANKYVRITPVRRRRDARQCLINIPFPKRISHVKEKKITVGYNSQPTLIQWLTYRISPENRTKYTKLLFAVFFAVKYEK